MAETAALAVTNLWKRYGYFEAVKGISFEVAPGEIFGLLGPNGAGKTSSIEIMIGLRPATSGTVSVFGADITHNQALARSMLGIQLQESDFFDHLKLAKQLRYLGACYGVKPDAVALDRKSTRLNSSHG